MTDKVQFELVSPERLLVSEPVEMVVVPGSEGDLGALPQHAPLITTIRPGLIDIYQSGEIADRIFVSGGFAEITAERVTVLAEEAIKLAELDAATAAERRRQAEAALAEAETDVARHTAQHLLAVAEAMETALGA